MKVARRLESDAAYDDLPEEAQERLFGRLRRSVQQACSKAHKADEEKPAKPAEVKDEAVKPTDAKPNDAKEEAVKPEEVKAEKKSAEETAMTG